MIQDSWEEEPKKTKKKQGKTVHKTESEKEMHTDPRATKGQEKEDVAKYPGWIPIKSILKAKCPSKASWRPNAKC